MKYVPEYCTRQSAIDLVAKGGPVLILASSLTAAKDEADSFHLITETPVVFAYWNAQRSKGATPMIEALNRYNDGENLVIVTVAESLPVMAMRLHRPIPTYLASYDCGDKLWSRLVAICGKMSSPQTEKQVDLFDSKAWTEMNERMAGLLKEQREVAHALAFTEVAQGVQQVHSGLLTVDEFFNMAVHTILRSPRLKAGDLCRISKERHPAAKGVCEFIRNVGGVRDAIRLVEGQCLLIPFVCGSLLDLHIGTEAELTPKWIAVDQAAKLLASTTDGSQYKLWELIQAQQHQLRALYFHHRIQAGLYKTRMVRHGGLNGPQFTEEELLADEIQTMHRHIGLAQRVLDGE